VPEGFFNACKPLRLKGSELGMLKMG